MQSSLSFFFLSFLYISDIHFKKRALLCLVLWLRKSWQVYYLFMRRQICSQEVGLVYLKTKTAVHDVTKGETGHTKCISGILQVDTLNGSLSVSGLDTL